METVVLVFLCTIAVVLGFVFGIWFLLKLNKLITRRKRQWFITDSFEGVDSKRVIEVCFMDTKKGISLPQLFTRGDDDIFWRRYPTQESASIKMSLRLDILEDEAFGEG